MKEYPEDIHKILLVKFVDELETMFANLNQEASAHQKLSQAQQGSNSVNTVIQQFELHGPPSKLGDAGLIDKFEQAISYHLCQVVYSSYPLPES